MKRPQWIAVGVCALLGTGVFQAVLLLAAHGSPATSAPAAVPSPAATAANPVPILARMHVPTSAVVGQVDVYGDRYATGQFPDGETVTVYTYADQQAMNAGVARNAAPSDTNKLLTGRLFTVTVTGVDAGSSGVDFPESLTMLAQETDAVIGH